MMFKLLSLSLWVPILCLIDLLLNLSCMLSLSVSLEPLYRFYTTAYLGQVRTQNYPPPPARYFSTYTSLPLPPPLIWTYRNCNLTHVPKVYTVQVRHLGTDRPISHLSLRLSTCPFPFPSLPFLLKSIRIYKQHRS